MGKYIGAKWLGIYPLYVGIGKASEVSPGGICTAITEEQAKTTRGWEPQYQVQEKKKEKILFEKKEQS